MVVVVSGSFSDIDDDDDDDDDDFDDDDDDSAINTNVRIGFSSNEMVKHFALSSQKCHACSWLIWM